VQQIQSSLMILLGSHSEGWRQSVCWAEPKAARDLDIR
jgi:hypothetical protein